MRSCQGKSILEMGDHLLTGGLKQLQTCNVPAYTLGRGYSEHELRQEDKTRSVLALREQSPEMLEGIIEGLFPRHDPSPWPAFIGQLGTGAGDEERVTDIELARIAKYLSVGRAPGSDGVPYLALKVAIAEVSEMFRSVIQKCLDDEVSPDTWKRQRLVLLPKVGKLPGDPLAYRPICLIDMTGKVLEKIILNRILRYTEGVNGLSSSQYAFRKGRSTVDAILSVTKIAEKALEPKRRGIRYCAVVTLDVRNAFNSAVSTAITHVVWQLQRRWRVDSKNG